MGIMLPGSLLPVPSPDKDRGYPHFALLVIVLTGFYQSERVLQITKNTDLCRHALLNKTFSKILQNNNEHNQTKQTTQQICNGNEFVQQKPV